MKIFHKTIIFAIYLTAAVTAIIGFLLFFPTTPIVINQNPAKILNPGKEIKSGDTVFYEVDYCKSTDKPAIVSKTLVNDVILPGVPEESNIEKGCAKKVASFQLPDIEIRGKHHLVITLTYQVNPFRKETVNFQTETFLIK